MQAASASREFSNRDELLTAIGARLRSSAGPPALTTASTDDLRRYQAVVLGCAAELDLLRIALRTEDTRRRTSEASLRASNSAMLEAVRQLGESLPGTKGAKRRPLRGKKRLMLYKMFGELNGSSSRIRVP
jgi:hypothetical protein